MSTAAALKEGCDEMNGVLLLLLWAFVGAQSS